MALNGVIVYSYNDQTEMFRNISSHESDEYFDTSDSNNSITYTDLSYHTEMHTFEDTNSSSESANLRGAYLSIEEEDQLKDQLRFRYESEKGQHGGLKPIIKLNNYSGSIKDIFIKVSLYTVNEKSLHVLELNGKECKEGVGWQKLTQDYIAKFSALSVFTKKKDEVRCILTDRKKSKLKAEGKKINEQTIEKEVREEMKSLNLNCFKFCFEAYVQKKIAICEKIFSKPIYNQKCTAAGELKITRLSSYSGSTKGGEDIILLCEKVRKDDIEIIFFEKDDSDVVTWEAKAEFNPADVHHQVAIPFKTPQYKADIEKEVFIKLCRKSDERSGEARTFLYKPVDELNHSSKRRKPNPVDEPSSSTIYGMDDRSLNQLLEWNMDFTEQWDLETYLQFPQDSEPVTPEANIDIDSLSLSPTRIKPKMFKSFTVTHTSGGSSNFDQFQMLKEGITSILKNRDKESFFKILSVLMSVKDENGNTLLHMAIKEKSEDLHFIWMLCRISNSLLINQANKSHMTPLHLAVSKNLLKVVKILLNSGADPNRKDRNGNNCTHLAAKYNHPSCLCALLTPLVCKKQGTQCPNINALNYEGFAPLHLSVINDSKKCTEALIGAKADVNIKDGKSGKTPLHFAYEMNDSLLELLLSQPKIDKYIEDYKGCLANSSNAVLNQSQKTNFQKPNDTCIDMPVDPSNIDANSPSRNIIEKSPSEEKCINQEIEKKLCKILNSNDDLWKKFGLYVMNDRELEVLAKMDSTPAKTILNELKKQHGKNYIKKLKFILFDSELKHVAESLQIS